MRVHKAEECTKQNCAVCKIFLCLRNDNNEEIMEGGVFLLVMQGFRCNGFQRLAMSEPQFAPIWVFECSVQAFHFQSYLKTCNCICSQINHNYYYYSLIWELFIYEFCFFLFEEQI